MKKRRKRIVKTEDKRGTEESGPISPAETKEPEVNGDASPESEGAEGADTMVTA